LKKLESCCSNNNGLPKAAGAQIKIFMKLGFININSFLKVVSTSWHNLHKFPITAVFGRHRSYGIWLSAAGSSSAMALLILFKILVIHKNSFKRYF
jgi:hypothetical protein